MADNAKPSPPFEDGHTTNEDNESENSPLLPATSAVKMLRKASARWITVEPVLLLAVLAFNVFLSTSPQYVKQRLADARDFSLSEDYSENGSCSTRNASDPNFMIEQEIQADTAFWSMLINSCGYLPGIVTGPVIGAWGDKAGRKIVLLLPVIGYLIFTTIYLFVIYFILPIWVIVLGSLIHGILGSYGLMIAGGAAYIADVTTKEKRALRIATLQAVTMAGMGIGQFITGLLIESAGFAAPFWMANALLLFCIVYIIVPPFLIETVYVKHVRGLAKYHLTTSALESVAVLFTTNVNCRRYKLIIILFAAFTGELITQGLVSFSIIYGLGPPFCWSPFIVGLFSGSMYVCGGIGRVGGIKVFSFCVSDTSILQIAYICSVIYCLNTAFSETTLQLFLGALLTCFRYMDQPIIQVLLSKLVGPNEQGVAFAVASSIQNCASFVSPLILNSIYLATVETQQNVVFLVGSAVQVIPIILLCTLHLLYHRTQERLDRQETEIKPRNTETYTQLEKTI